MMVPIQSLVNHAALSGKLLKLLAQHLKPRGIEGDSSPLGH